MNSDNNYHHKGRGSLGKGTNYLTLSHQCIDEEDEYLLVSDGSACSGVEAAGASSSYADNSSDNQNSL